MPDTFAATIQLTVIAMGVVFGVLITLGLLITLFKVVLGLGARRSTPAPAFTLVDPTEAEDELPESEEIEDSGMSEQTVAVISAAVYAYMGTSRRRPRPTAQPATNHWLLGGRQELMAARKTGRR